MPRRTKPKAVPSNPTGQGSATGRLSGWKKVLFAACAGLLFFVAVEMVLWMAGAQTLIESEDPFRGFSNLVRVFERHDDVYRTRRSDQYKTFNAQSFSVEKPANGLRLFCLGGSSAYGFPWGADAAFTAILGDALAVAHPDRVVEAVNASGTSYAMHRLRILANEIVEYEPDILIVYSGHNEFVETSFYERLKQRTVIRTRFEHALAHSRVYSLARALIAAPGPQRSAPKEGLDPFVRREENRTFATDEKEAIIDRFRENLEHIIVLARRRGVKVVLATVPCNLREWEPAKSLVGAVLDESGHARRTEALRIGRHRLDAGRFGDAIQSLLTAQRLAPGHAQTHYMLARAYEGLGQWDRARQSYELACDRDASPIRRVSQLNDVIREVGKQKGVRLVDADAEFQRRSEHGLVGFNLIEDYVHPTLEGHRLIAWQVWQAIEQAGWLGTSGSAERALFDEVVSKRAEFAPAGQVTWLFNQAYVLAHQGRRDQAIKKYRQALYADPNYKAALYNLAVMLSEVRRHEEASGLFLRLLELDPEHAEGRAGLGGAMLELKRLDDAVAHLQSALELRPGFAPAQINLVKALYSRGDHDEALVQCRLAIGANPDHGGVRKSMGTLMLFRGAHHEAINHLLRAVALTPDDADAHFRLGLAYRAAGQASDAVRCFRQVLQIDAAHKKARFLLQQLQQTANQ